MSDTPETDHLETHLGCAAIHSHPILWEHNRKLERERNEARINAQKSKAYKRVLKETNLRQTERIRYLEGATNHACGTPLSRALKERDEAREGLEEETKFHHRTHMELVQTQCKLLDNQNDNRQLADRLTELELHSTSELARLECERDEAREEVRLLKAILDLIKKDVS